MAGLSEAILQGGLLPLLEQNGIVESEVRLVEAEDNESNLPDGVIGLVEGVAGKADIINRNRRFYSKKVYELAVARAQPLIKEGNFLGEVDHPWVGTLGRAAVRFTHLWMEGDLMQFKAVILDTAGGRHLKALLNGGVGVKVSTRGYGSVTYEKRNLEGADVEIAVVGEDFQMEGIDFVLFQSNPHGRVTHHEHQESPQEAISMNEELLRQEHPELVAAIESAAREGYVAREEHEAAVAAARSEGEKAVRESEEVTGAQKAISAIVEALRPLVPELQKVEESAQVSEAERRVAELEAQVNQLVEKVSALTSEKEKLEEETKKAEARRAIEEKVAAVLEGFAHADLLRDELLACESVEEVESLFATRKNLIEAIAARATVRPEGDEGVGHADARVEEPNTDSTPDAVKEAVEEQRRLAGLSA